RYTYTYTTRARTRRRARLRFRLRSAPWPRRVQQCRQLPDALQADELAAAQVLVVHPLEGAGQGVRDVDADAADLEHGQHVGPQGVARHEEAPRLDGVACGEHAVAARVLLRHDLDCGEVVAEAGARELALLVVQVALGHEHQAVPLRQLAHRVRQSEEHTSELQSRENLVCRLLL